jgi:hypothetical protein
VLPAWRDQLKATGSLLTTSSYRHKVGSIELLTSIEMVVSTPLRAGGF